MIVKDKNKEYIFKDMKEEEENEIVAVINFTFGEVSYIVPVDNWNTAVEEGRTMPIILGDELHFMTPDDYKKIENAQFMVKPSKFII